VAQVVTLPNGDAWSFEVDAFRRDCLLQGLDDVGITLQSTEAIRAFEEIHARRFPWLFEDLVL
jgi:3-isopropylmalate/(R)-2-methylmalate dehydratase small subunit